MIPRHRPPFGPISLIWHAFGGILSGATIEELERAYCETLQVPYAVWLPSARYGITRSIQLHTPKAATVVCPVFNCGAVHHAARETGRPVKYVDCGANSFLMNCETAVPDSGSHSVILSEMFGHRFSIESLRQPLIADATVRIFDMAMAIPNVVDMDRLRQNDVCVVSFGLGKSLYAGWGGMAFTMNRRLANDLRTCRNNAFHSFGLVAQTKCFFQMLARTAAHEPLVYEQLRRLKASANSESPDSLDFSSTSHEWGRPPTGFHLSLALKNLELVSDSVTQRTCLAEIYRRELPARVVSSETAAAIDDGLSHFSIRVPAADRDAVRSALWADGVDVGTLFPFPHHIANAAEFPNAAAAANEILNLPLSCQLRPADIQRICEAVESSLAVNSVSHDPAELKVAA